MTNYSREDVIQIQHNAYWRGQEVSSKRIAELESAVRFALAWLDNFGKHAPIEFGGEQELHDTLQSALAAEHYLHTDPPSALIGDGDFENPAGG